MMTTPVSYGLLGTAINWQGLLVAVPLVAVLLLLFYLYQRANKKRPPKPGMLLRYEVADKNAAACRGRLGQPEEDDIFRYTLESAPAGGWYIHFTGHRPTQQQLDTLYLLQFEDDMPAVFSLKFVREAFGMKEPIIGEALLDDFFAQKLAAKRLPRMPAEAQ